MTDDELRPIRERITAELAVAEKFVTMHSGTKNHHTLDLVQASANDAANAREKLALLDEVERLRKPPSTYPCQGCGRSYPPHLLFDLKGNVPGGCKATCLECCGRLEMRDRSAAIAESFGTEPTDDAPGVVKAIAAAIRALTLWVLVEQPR